MYIWVNNLFDFVHFIYNCEEPLGHVYKSVDIFIVTAHVLVFDEPFQLLLYHLLRWEEHVLQYLHKFALQQV